MIKKTITLLIFVVISTTYTMAQYEISPNDTIVCGGETILYKMEPCYSGYQFYRYVWNIVRRDLFKW